MIKYIFKTGMLLTTFGAMVSCSTNMAEDSTKASQNTPVVGITNVNAVEHANRIRTIGRLAFNNEYKMSFKTGGVVEAVHVRAGQSVGAGKVLASLRLDEIQAKTSQAGIAVAKAERDYARTKALYADSVATLEQLQNVESQLKSAQHNLRAAQFNQDQSEIIAPSNGVIQKVLVKENEITGAGTPIIIFGAENQGKVLIANVSDVDVVKITPGDKATLQFDAWPETIFEGQVLEIEGMANPTTGTYKIKIQVDDAHNQLKPGFIGSANITSSSPNRYIEIPIESLVQADERTGVVYKVENELAIKQEVHVAEITNEKLLISNGISENDKVIIQGLNKLSGDSISVKPSF